MIIETKSGILQLPAFLPDATHAALKGMSIEDVKSTNTPGLVTNTYHLILDGLIDTIEKYGGIHKYMGYIIFTAFELKQLWTLEHYT